MNKKRYIIALDQGTTSSRSLVLDAKANIISMAQQELTQIYPRPGWVEHDPQEIWARQSATLRQALTQADIAPDEVAAIGITNQRETTVIWEKETGKPVYNAIVWQCRRTAPICEKLKADGLEDHVRKNTGLLLDPYFSGTKIAWILDNVEGARGKADRGELLFGTIDSWLIWNLTQGRIHVTDYTNASRTMIFNIHTLEWDDVLLKALNIPRSMLPEIKPSSAVYGQANIGGRGDTRIPIAGAAGDQQAALFGHLCVEAGQAKNTYGTGCFLLMHTGNKAVTSRNGLLTTIACDARGGAAYALEGSVFVAGAAIQWLRDELRFFDDAKDSAYFADKVGSSNGVYVVPAFAGLGAPYWDPDARGAILGLTRGVNRNHIMRATLESIAYQTKDVLDAMLADFDAFLEKVDAGFSRNAVGKIDLQALRVDGGAVSNDFLMQFQADILQRKVERPQILEKTALGAAYLAGLATGFWEGVESLAKFANIARTYSPSDDLTKQQERYAGWQRAVNSIRNGL